jgi:opacity protein-like surface antigen
MRELMRDLEPLLVVGFVIAGAASSAEAQRQSAVQTPPRAPVAVVQRVPDAGMIAAGVAISPTATASQFLDNGLEFAGVLEGYLSEHVSLRGQVGTASWDIVGLSYSGTLRPLFFLGNAVVGWGGAEWRPYITAGGGVYRYGFTEAGVTGSNTKSGFDFGGGTEYFFTPDATITLEGLYHKVGLVPTNRARLGFKGSFWSFTVGGKKYF